jgi:hypothetical protein
MPNSLQTKLKFSKFITDNKTIDTINKAIIGKNNIFTINTSTTAYIPPHIFNNIYIGSLITANNQTRYVISKNNTNNSLELNNEVNWNNLNKGFPFVYNNPIKQILDKSNNIVGYITNTGQIYLSRDFHDLKINKLISTNEDGIKILSNNKGIYIDNNGRIFYGEEGDWSELDIASYDLDNLHIDGGYF